MTTRFEAEENLRVIRSLMERATIYRAISAPVALVGGMAALLGCVYMAAKSAPANMQTIPANMQDVALNMLFFAAWMGVLAITAITNIFFLWQDAKRRGDVFISSGMRAALRALGPCHLVAMLLTILWSNSAWMLPVPWMILYGLSLLATQHFAPHSIALLGWAFLMAGICALAAFKLHPALNPSELLRAANLLMGATFGLFHIIYAICAWPRKTTSPNSGDMP